MKDNSFSSTEPPPSLVQALLELDEVSSVGSDEEFLDFQFRIADANANNAREREKTTDLMADWRASFASLQLKQAHEVAEFALARRREDEVQIERQAKEINELRKTLEAIKLEAERVKANCTRVTEEKLIVENELAQQIYVCESFRENVNELSQAQGRISGENSDLKRALDEAVVTTGRLKFALEEKAAELVAWLAHEGLAPQGLTPLVSEDELSPKPQEKSACTVQYISMYSSGDAEKPETSFAKEEPLSRISMNHAFGDEDDLLTSATEKMIIALEEEFEDMKHEVQAGARKVREDVQDPCLPLKAEPGIGLGRDRSMLGVFSSKDKNVVGNLRRRIKDLQIELERLQSLESILDEQQPSKSMEYWIMKHSLVQTSYGGEDCENRYRQTELSTNKGSDGALLEPGLIASCSDESCSSIDLAGNQLPVIGSPKGSILDSNVLRSVTGEVVGPEMTEMQLGDSFNSLEHSEVNSVCSQADLEDKFICVNRNQPWSVVIISKLVESITEELTKLSRVVVKAINVSGQHNFADLETRVKSWSNITTKTLQSKVSRTGAIEEWRNLVVDFLGQALQELMAVQQRLLDCESELALMDKLQAECLAASQNNAMLEDEIHKLEAQSFHDQIEREEEVNLLKKELEQAKQLGVEYERKAAEEQMVIVSLREQLNKCEMELENSRTGWAAEQDFIDSCLGVGKEEPGLEERIVDMKEVETMEKKVQDLMYRLEENERELGELLIISHIDPDSVMSAKLRRLEQKLEDVTASKEILETDKAELSSQVISLKAKLAEVEHELQLENQQHVEMLIRYEEEQGHLEASTRSETGVVSAKFLDMERLLAGKTKQLELAQQGHGPSNSEAQLVALRGTVLTLESSLAVTTQKAVDCEMAIKSQMNKETAKYANLESKFVALQSNLNLVKTQFGELEQRERRAQSTIEKLVVELGIAKEEVLKYEVRLQKTIRQSKEDIEAERRKQEEIVSSQKQMEWHLCRQLELTEGLEREKAKLREVLVEFEQQNLALLKESDNLRTAYLQLARQT